MGSKRNHPGHIAKRGESSWRVTLCVDGDYHRFTVRGPRSKAEQKARTEYDRLQKRSTAGLPGPMTFAQLLERYREDKLPLKAPNTQRDYGSSLEAFVEGIEEALARAFPEYRRASWAAQVAALELVNALHARRVNRGEDGAPPKVATLVGRILDKNLQSAALPLPPENYEGPEELRPRFALTQAALSDFVILTSRALARVL